MAICPKCKKEINELVNVQSGWTSYKMYMKPKDKIYPEYDRIEFNTDDGVNDFSCPECSGVLFTSEDEAIEFLNDSDELKSIVKEKLNKIKDKNGKKK